MNTKVIIAIIAVVVVVAAAAAVVITNGDKDDDDDFVMNEGFVFEVDTVAAVYGNANGDDRIDSKDVTLLNSLIGTELDTEKYPYADANQDGSITSADVTIVKNIIDGTACDVYYKNYYGEAQKVAYPLTGKKIGLTYWQQGQLVDLLGHFGDVVIANASITTARANQYDVSGIVGYGTTGSSKLTEEYCEMYATAGVDLIIGSPYKSTVADVAAQYLPDVPLITLGIGGSACVSSALTLGILMQANEAAQNYEKYVVDTIKTIKERLSVIDDEDKPSMLITRMYADNDAYISKYGGILVNCANTDGTYQLLSMFCNLYTDNTETSTTPARTTEWILSQDFDLILDMEVYTGFQTSSYASEKFYTPGEYNERFENSVEYFKGTKAYNNGGVLSSSYIFDGYSGFASLMMSAYMIYPSLFTLDEGQNSLQYWYDEFTNVDVDVKTQGGYIYTGTKYVPQFNKSTSAELTLLSSDVSATLNVCGNVNGDCVIDSKDIDALKAAISAGTTSQFEVKDAKVWKDGAITSGTVNLGDANGDGTVDSADVTYIQSIIDATFASPVEVVHLNRYTNGDYWTTSTYPTESFASTGAANLIMMYLMLDIKDQIKAISYNGGIDYTLFADYQYLFNESITGTFSKDNAYTYRTGNSAGYFYEELLANHITNDKITAIITCDNAGSYLKGGSGKGITEAQAENLNLDVIRVAPACTDSSKYISDLALIAFFTKADPSVCNQLVTWYSTAIADLNEKLVANVGVTVDQVRVGVSSATQYVKNSDDTVTTYNYISSGTSDYTAVAVSAGGYFAFKNYNFGTSSSSAKATDLGKWLLDYDVDKLICIKTGAVGTSATSFSWYGGTALTTGLSTVQQCALAFSDSEPYYDNEIYVVSGDMPVILRVLYTASVLYPTVFSDSWADSYNSDYCTKFLGLTADQVAKGIFHVSMEDMGLNGKA